MWRPVLLSATLCSLVFLAACGGGGQAGATSTPSSAGTPATLSNTGATATVPSTPSSTPAVQPGRIAPDEPSTNVRQLTIQDGSLNPSNIITAVTQPVELHVTNQSSTACNFTVTGFTQPQTIQPGQTATITFNATGAATQDVPMGCAGDSSRQGTFRYNYTGILPAGR